MVEILIAAALGVLAGALGTAAWLRRNGPDPTRPPRERRTGGAAAALQRAILDSLQDGVVVYDENERIVFFNPAASEVLGVSRESLAAGVRTWDPLDAEGRTLDEDARPVAITARTGEPCVGVDIGLRTQTGDVRWTTVSTRALHAEPADNGRYAVVVALVKTRKPGGWPLMRSNMSAGHSAVPAATSVMPPSSNFGSAPLMRRNAPSSSTCLMKPRKSL